MLQAIYAIIGLVLDFAGAGDTVLLVAWAFLGIAQRSIIHLYAKLYRLDHRRRRARQATVAVIPSERDGPGGVAT